tara:strand:+ start:153 stop:806 length:654 start_codon:yes stop_codon:yes gene_type:complete
MKTKMTMLTMFVLLSFMQAVNAQKLKDRIKESVVKIGTTFIEIPEERLKLLDQIAFTMIRKRDDKGIAHVVLVDANNHEISQLAMVWLTTGILYYGHEDLFHIQSAGLAADNQKIPGLRQLKEYGFTLKDNQKNGVMGYRLKYGSGSWEVYGKALSDLQVPEGIAIKIFLQDNLIDNSIDNNLVLDSTDSSNIAKEMLYLATRINNLLIRNQKKQQL